MHASLLVINGGAQRGLPLPLVELVPLHAGLEPVADLLPPPPPAAVHHLTAWLWVLLGTKQTVATGQH